MSDRASEAPTHTKIQRLNHHCWGTERVTDRVSESPTHKIQRLNHCWWKARVSHRVSEAPTHYVHRLNHHCWWKARVSDRVSEAPPHKKPSWTFSVLLTGQPHKGKRFGRITGILPVFSPMSHREIRSTVLGVFPSWPEPPTENGSYCWDTQQMLPVGKFSCSILLNYWSNLVPWHEYSSWFPIANPCQARSSRSTRTRATATCSGTRHPRL